MVLHLLYFCNCVSNHDMKKISFPLLLLTQLFVCSVAIAGISPGRFSGVVTDISSGQPLGGVSILLSDVKQGTYTNARGEFTLSNISEGDHLVEISHIGYATIAETINITGDSHKDFVLSTTIIENNAVVVTGVSKATELKKMPFQVSVMRKEELLQTTSTNIMEAITRKPGISTISSGPAVSKPLIRGLGYNRVLTINDGVRQEGQQWGDEHGIEIDETSVNKIEILKGPASLIYGSDAMAGVINILTNVPVQTNSMKFNLGSNYQTNNRLRTLYGNWAGNKQGFSWNAYSSLKAAADYKNKYDGYVFNSKFNEHNLGGSLGLNGRWGYSHLLLSNFNLKTGLVEGERDNQGFFMRALPGGLSRRATSADFNSTTPAIPYQHIRHFKIASDNNVKFGQNRLALNVGWQRNQREEFGNPDNANERALYFDLKTFTYTTQLHFGDFDGWKTSVGANGMHQVNTNRGVEQLIPDYALDDIGGYGFLQKDFKKLSVSGGARYDSRHIKVHDLLDGAMIKSAAFNKSFQNFSGSAGLAFQAIKSLNLKLNIARAFRAPAIPELASNGSHEGTNRYEYGDPDLKSELSTQTDAAIEFTNQHFSLNVAAYINSFKNFIFYRKLEAAAGGDSTLIVHGSTLTAFKFDQRASTLAGMEIVLDMHPHPLDWLHLENSFSMVAGRFKEAIEGSSNIPFMPAPKLLTELRADFKKFGSSAKDFYIKFEIENNFKQSRIFTAYGTETPTPAYKLFNAGIGTDIINKKRKTLFIVNLAANNIGDLAYQNHLSRLKYGPENLATGRTGVYNMGRNFSLKINIPISVSLKEKSGKYPDQR
ncbi:MAG: TonB-dependent receptor [Ferruginibacter sp.]|nr:TonB-dependent receptor [Ferruginibacter sp.]